MDRRPDRSRRSAPPGRAARPAAPGVPPPAPAHLGNQQAQRLMQAIARKEAHVGRRDDAVEHQGDAAGPQAAAQAPPASSVIEQALGTGRPLDAGAQAHAERRLGQSLADVRVHDGAAAAASAAALGTRAFTDGRHIAFAEGQYRPEQIGTGCVIDHELAHVARGDADGRVLRRDPLAAQMPAEIGPVAAGVSFELPAGKALTGSWNDLSTVNPTTVTLAVRPAGIDLAFSPALRIDAQWPVSDIDWSGLHYDFASAGVSSVGLASTQSVAASAGHGTARSQITGFFTGLLAGSRMAAAGYDPLADPDLMGTLDRIRANFLAAPSSGGNVTAADVSNVTLFAEATVRGPVRAGAGDGSVSIDGTVRVAAQLQGTGTTLGADATAGRSPRVQRLTLSGGSIIVRSGNDDIAQLHQIGLAFGGEVAIERMTLLGRAADFANAESGLRVLGLLLLLGAGTPSDRLALSQAELPDLNAQLVPGLTRAMIQQALTRALVQFIRQNSGLFPGVDLAEVFGTGTLGDFPAPVPPAGPGSAFG